MRRALALLGVLTGAGGCSLAIDAALSGDDPAVAAGSGGGTAAVTGAGAGAIGTGTGAGAGTTGSGASTATATGAGGAGSTGAGGAGSTGGGGAGSTGAGGAGATAATSSGAGGGSGQGASTTGAGGAPGVCSPSGTDTLSDDFEDGTIGPAWQQLKMGTVNLNETNGHAVVFLPNGPANGAWGEYRSTAGYDLGDCHVTVKIPGVTNPATAAYSGLVLRRVADPEQYIEMVESGGSLSFAYKVAGVKTTVGGAPYDAGSDLWWRVREAGGAVYFETSGDGSTWAPRADTATPFDVGAVRIGLVAGNAGNDSGSGQGRFDDLNLAP